MGGSKEVPVEKVFIAEGSSKEFGNTTVERTAEGLLVTDLAGFSGVQTTHRIPPNHGFALNYWVPGENGTQVERKVSVLLKEKQKIVMVSGYPRVVGVNMPTPGEPTPEIKPKGQQEVKLPQKSQPAGGHDLRGGHATQGGSR